MEMSIWIQWSIKFQYEISVCGYYDIDIQFNSNVVRRNKLVFQKNQRHTQKCEKGSKRKRVHEDEP